MLILAQFMPVLSLGIAIWWFVNIEPTLDGQGNRIWTARDARPLIAILLGQILMFGGIAYHAYARPPLKAIPAAPFPAFPGCDPDRARSAPYLSQRCVDYHFAIDDYYKLGLEDPGKGLTWYRVGDDALLLRCSFDRSFPCHVENGHLNMFVRPRPARGASGSA